MMQPDTILLEAFTCEFWIAFADPDRCSSSNVVAEIKPIMNKRHAKLRQKTAVECAGFFELTDGQDYMRHSININYSLFLPQVVVIALPNDLTASARPGEGGIFSPRSHAGRARIRSIQRSKSVKPSVETRAQR